jgi:hypothetical protein
MRATHPGAGVRAVGDDEVAHFRAKGWVKLERLFTPWVVEELLARARERMGSQPMTVSRSSPAERTANEFHWYARWDGCSQQDEWIRSLSHSAELAGVASALMDDRPPGGDDAVRFYFDHFFVKVPVSSRGGPTPWHQDLPHHPLDRQGVLTIWVALVDCPPEKGSLRFLSGSHRAGLLGRYLNRRDEITLVDEHPWVLDRFELSPPLHLRPGDATVHDLAIVHHAPENVTDSPRWVYAVQWLPPSARYTGAPNHRTDGLGLQVDRPLEHARFPVISPRG